MEDAVHVELRNIKDTQRDHHRTLYGNGRPGLVNEVASIKTMLKAILTVVLLTLGAVITHFVAGK
jgi:hypothetical protein